ncbi:hypothetical protein HN011_006979 [Eciton burchellii]|nr:hypothetical protein HN011_006979 [Eciton burchellii]
MTATSCQYSSRMFYVVIGVNGRFLRFVSIVLHEMANKIAVLFKEIAPFLDPSIQPDIKTKALDYVLGITGTHDGRQSLLNHLTILKQLLFLMQDSSASISRDAGLALINITGDEPGARLMLTIAEDNTTIKDDTIFDLNIVRICMNNIMDTTSILTDICCMILSNMTRPVSLLDRMITFIEQSGFTWVAIVSAFTTRGYNTTGATLHYLGSVLNNLSQSSYIRRCLMNRDHNIIQSLLPWIESKHLIRKGGIIGTLKNCTFELEDHEWLLSPQVDLLPSLLLPLAGPEKFDDEDNAKLPIKLQHLPKMKMRESDSQIRLMLLESLNQLCATKIGREILREKNTYVILRELHKCEVNRTCLLTCQNIVDILIRTEEEIGLNNLKEVEVPLEYVEKFHEMDKNFIEDV